MEGLSAVPGTARRSEGSHRSVYARYMVRMRARSDNEASAHYRRISGSPGSDSFWSIGARQWVILVQTCRLDRYSRIWYQAGQKISD